MVLAVGDDHHPLPVHRDASARKVHVRLPGSVTAKRTGGETLSGLAEALGGALAARLDQEARVMAIAQVWIEGATV